MPMSIINPTDFDRHFDSDFISLILLIVSHVVRLACVARSVAGTLSVDVWLSPETVRCPPLSVSYNIVVMEAWGRLEDMWDLRNGALISSSNIIHFNYDNFS